MQIDEVILSFLVGISLAAACGFRVFVPMLVMCLAVRAGWINLNPSLAFLASTPALICFSVATVAEILAYKIPWVDNALDTIATPAAVIAGTLAVAGQFTFTGSGGDLLKWGIAAIAGGGVAAAVQATTVVGRGASTLLTGGVGNPIFATVESGTSVVMSILAIFVPILAALLFIAFSILAVWLILRWRSRRAQAQRLVPVVNAAA